MELKNVKDMAAKRKRSSDLIGGSAEENNVSSSIHAAKSPTKNLLAEFEKDDTLEPNSQVFADVNAQKPKSSTNVAVPVRQPQPKAELDGEAREAGFQGRQERRD